MGRAVALPSRCCDRMRIGHISPLSSVVCFDDLDIAQYYIFPPGWPTGEETGAGKTGS